MERSAKRRVVSLTGTDVGVDNEEGRILVNMRFFGCSCERSYVHTCSQQASKSYLCVLGKGKSGCQVPDQWYF